MEGSHKGVFVMTLFMLDARGNIAMRFSWRVLLELYF
jgi:hypothetical protein